MTRPPSTQRTTPRRAPWGAANWVVGLGLATSAVAHVEAGGLLPGLPGSALLLLVMGLSWLLASRTTRTWVGLLANLVLGQVLCHVSYAVGTMRPPTLIVDADGTRHWGDPMAGVPMGGMPMPGMPMGDPVAAAAPHAGHAMGGMDAMAGMHHGTHPGLAMLAAHATAVVVGTLLVLAVRCLPGATHRWLRTLLPTPPRHLLVLPSLPTGTRPRPRTPLWAHAPPPPRRGPPVLA